jgi:hypothetical protein
MVQNGPNGNGRQPNGQFQPGTSGNPGGRPRDIADMRESAQTYAGKALDTLAELLDSDNQRVRVQAATAILDRAYGKPATNASEGPSVKPLSQMSYAEAAEVLEVTEADIRRLVQAGSGTAGD